MNKILSLLLALLISTNAYAGETEINRLKSVGFGVSQANEIDSIYIDTTNAQILTSPTVSGNLTFSTAAAKIIPGATSLTFRNNADSASNLVIADNGNLTLRGDVTFSTGPNILSAGTMILGTSTATSLLLKANSLTRWTIDSTAGALAQDATNGGNILMPKVASGISVGGTYPASDGVQPSFWAQSDTVTNVQYIAQQSTADVNGPQFQFLKTRATDGTGNTIVGISDVLGQITFRGADGTTFRDASAIKAILGNTPGAGDMPGALQFQTTPDGSTTLATVLTLEADKSALFTGTVRSSATGNIGWSLVAAVAATCDATCTSACVIGQITATQALASCGTSITGNCLCAGAS